MNADLICVYLRSSAAPLGGKRLRHYIPQECLATAPFCPPPPLTRNPQAKRAATVRALTIFSFFPIPSDSRQGFCLPARRDDTGSRAQPDLLHTRARPREPRPVCPTPSRRLRTKLFLR